jgi:hypothetical protein
MIDPREDAHLTLSGFVQTSMILLCLLSPIELAAGLFFFFFFLLFSLELSLCLSRALPVHSLFVFVLALIYSIFHGFF